MKNRLILPLLALSLNACNLNNPEANRIVGTWIVEGSAPAPGVTRNNYILGAPKKGTDITFTRKGAITGQVFFDGGWCKRADKYKVKTDTIFLEYGKPGCIPLIPPQITDRVAILELNRKILRIRYGGYDIALNRK